MTRERTSEEFFQESEGWLDLVAKAITVRCEECEDRVQAIRIHFSRAKEEIQDRYTVELKGDRHKFLTMWRYQYASHRLASGRLCSSSGLQVPWRLVTDAALKELRGKEST